MRQQPLSENGFKKFRKKPLEANRVWGDSACTGQTEVMSDCVLRTRDFTQAKASRNRSLTDRAGKEYSSPVCGLCLEHLVMTKTPLRRRKWLELQASCACIEVGGGRKTPDYLKQGFWVEFIGENAGHISIMKESFTLALAPNFHALFR